LIEQWGTFNYSNIARNFLIVYTTIPMFSCVFNSNSADKPQYREFPRAISETQWNQLYGDASISNGTWIAKGY